MTTRAYENWKPRGGAVELVLSARAICQEYANEGYDLTLRQLYYQHVARGYIPNNQRSYKRLGDIINRARMSGLLDWNSIVDRTRNLAGNSHWSSPREVVQAAADSYRTDLWANQPTRVEVWVEKEALAGVIGRVAKDRDVDYFSCRGYVSQSELWRAAQRHFQYILSGQSVVVLHLGDHDPSGIDMTRDITDRLMRFNLHDWMHSDHFTGNSATRGQLLDEMNEHIEQTSGVLPTMPVEVRRIALNYDQIERYDPPPNPAKLTDARANSYIERFGPQSWELDALPPNVLSDLIETHIDSIVDAELMNEAVVRRDEERETLAAVASRYDEIERLLGGDAH